MTMVASALAAPFLFDADAHVLEPPDLWDSYLDPAFRHRSIQFRRTADGIDQLFVDNQLILPNCTAALGGAELDRNQAMDPRSRLGYLDGAPRSSMFGSDRDRLVIAAHLNLRDIPGAVKELELRLDQGFKGVFLAPERVDGKGFADPHFDPLWARIEEAGVPLLVHVIVRTRRLVTGLVGDWYDTPANRTFTFALGAASQVMPACMAMVMDGLFDKFPHLKVVAIEAGCGWVPYAMDRLDEKYRHFRGFDAELALGRPSEYFRRNLWFVAEPEERTIGSGLELVGRDRILWGSDFPHIDANLDAPELIRASVARLSDADQRAVLGENARRLFAL